MDAFIHQHAFMVLNVVFDG